MTTSTVRYGLAAGAAVLLLLLTLIVMFASSGSPTTPDLGINASHVLKPDAPIPAQYLLWVTRAGNICPDIGPALIAAQIDVESSWREDAVAVNPPENGGNANF